MTLLVAGYAASHFLVDFVCAWAMFSFFSSGPAGYRNLLIYNFCAFALQMPLGAILDGCRNRERLPMIWSLVGAGITVAGAFAHPALLGLGNALFHVGGGVDVLHADFRRGSKGRLLGIFVAPGALGLYLGGKLGKGSLNFGWPLAAAVLLMALAVCLLTRARQLADPIRQQENRQGIQALLACCFAVVILRSWAGLGITFPWKARFSLLSVLCVALGKALGGIVAAKFGMKKTMVLSLTGAAFSFVLGNQPVFGLLALLLFNMTMPLTLYLLAEKLPNLPGFSFGLLTFGLFLGFLPVYYQVDVHLPGTTLGALISLVSLALLLVGRKAVKSGVLS